jgi:hypothetical protein
MRGTKSSRATQRGQFRMIPAGDTQIAAEIQALPPQSAGRSGEGTQRQIGLAGLEFRLDMIIVPVRT